MSLSIVLHSFTKSVLQKFLTELGNTKYRKSWLKPALVDLLMTYETDTLLKVFTTTQLSLGLESLEASQKGKKEEKSALLYKENYHLILIFSQI